MKRKIATLTFAIVVAFQCFGQITEADLFFKLQQHPYLLMNNSEKKAIQHQIRKDKLWAQIHNDIITTSKTLLSVPIQTRKVIGRRLLDVSRESIRRIFYLSYAWRMTGNKEFAERAEREIIAVCQFSDWNPSHFLDVAEMTLAVAIGYDWCIDAISKENKQIITNAIIEKGLEESLKPQNCWWTKAEHNWNQVCNTGLVYGALVTAPQKPDLAKKIIARAINTIPVSMGGFAPNGAYAEGIGYWEYGTSFMVLLIDALKRNFGNDFGLSQMPGFNASALYSQHMITPSGVPYAYSDVGTAIMSFSSTIFWFYAQSKEPELLYMQKKLLELDNKKKYLRNRLLPFALIFGAGSQASLANPQEPQKLMYVGKGITPIAAMRSSWSSPNALYLGFKAGSPSTNHAHMDIGSFFFEWSGVRWAHDLGMQSYSIPEAAGVDLWNREQNSQRWDVYRINNRSHSLPIINNKYQQVAGRVDIDGYTTDPEFMSVWSDITSVMPYTIQKLQRGVALVNKSYVVVEDVITTKKFYNFYQWNMMTEADQIKQIDEKTVLLSKKDKKLYLRIEAPFKVDFYSHPVCVSKPYDSENKGIYSVGWQCELPRETTSKIKVYLMPQKMTTKISERNIIN